MRPTDFIEALDLDDRKLMRETKNGGRLPGRSLETAHQEISSPSNPRVCPTRRADVIGKP
jgi:hypothetical protein